MSFSISNQQIEDFHRDGYIIVKGLFDSEEVDMLLTTARNDAAMNANAREIEDADGKRIAPK